MEVVVDIVEAPSILNITISIHFRKEEVVQVLTISNFCVESVMQKNQSESFGFYYQKNQ